MDIDVELIIDANGLIFVPRGNKEENIVSKNIFPEIDFNNFMEISEDFQNLYGTKKLCG